MKKILAIMVVLFMAMTAMVPLISADNGYGGYAIDDIWDGQKTGQTYTATGKINVLGPNGGDPSPGQGDASQTNPNMIDPKIIALWETKGDNYNDENPYDMYDTDLDDCPMLEDWCQVDPPMTHGAYTKVRAWVAIDVQNYATEGFDPTLVKFDRSWPDNIYVTEVEGELFGLGDGSVPEAFEDMHPTNYGTWEDYDRAAMLHDEINHKFIDYEEENIPIGDYTPYEYMEYLESETRLVIVYKEFELYYHDPAGWYDIEVQIQTGNWPMKMNYFEYVMGIGIETDFEILNWGNMNGDGLHKWYAHHGNWIFNPNEYDGSPYSEKPTIRSIGNWDAVLGVMFSKGTFTHDEDVRFDVRVGESNPGWDRYNVTYAGVDLTDTDSYFGVEETRPGIVPGVLARPLPIDNEDSVGNDLRNDVLLKCHTAKLDFYVNPHQWNEYGEHTFDIILSVYAPDYDPFNPHEDIENGDSVGPIE